MYGFSAKLTIAPLNILGVLIRWHFLLLFPDDLVEKNQKEVTIHDLDPLALTLLVDFSYTGEIVISEDNVQVSYFWLKVALLTICFIISFQFWERLENFWLLFVFRYLVQACWVAEMFEFLHFSLRSIENKIKCQQQMYILWVESPLCK